MATYICDRCNRYRTSNGDGYHEVRYSFEPDPLQLCNLCMDEVAREYDEGKRAPEEVDGLPIVEALGERQE